MNFSTSVSDLTLVMSSVGHGPPAASLSAACDGGGGSAVESDGAAQGWSDCDGGEFFEDPEEGWSGVSRCRLHLLAPHARTPGEWVWERGLHRQTAS